MVMAKLWLDDYRPAPEGWHHVKTAPDAIAALSTGQYDEISLDYDLWPGDNNTGYAVACWIARSAYDGMPRLKWHLHSDNIPGREKILRAMKKAEQFWTENEMTT
jgi:hypothetical protein